MSQRVDAGAVSIAVERHGDTDCDLFAAHANGFCKETLHPLVDAVTARVPGIRPWLIDLRGHGESDRGEPPYGMPQFGDDVLAVMATTSSTPVGLGHSSGGTAVAIAQLADPTLFSALVLVEPIFLPPPHERMDHPLARIAERRRRSFPSRDAARERFASGPFFTWTDEAIDAYVDHGFEDVDGEWALRCAPEVEADVYREGANHDAWDRLGDIDIPVTIVVGERSDTHVGLGLEALIGQFSDPMLEIIPGAGHFSPMERPDAVAGVVAEVLASADRA